MTDSKTIDLSAVSTSGSAPKSTGESIPAMLAAPKPARAKAKPLVAPEPISVQTAPAPLRTPTPTQTTAPVLESIPPAAVPAVTAVEETPMATTIENVAQTATDKGQAMFAEMNNRSKGAMEKGTKMFEDATAFSKGNIEAIVESSKIASTGLQSMGQHAAEYAKMSFESATQAMKTLAATKSPTEFFKLQGDYARTAFDAMIAETSKSTESVLKLAGEVAQPISSRFAMAAEKMKIAA